MIKFIAGGRRSGRTTQIIKMAEIENAYILVSDHGRARSLCSLAEKLGYHIRFPITFHEFWRARNTGYISKLLIDDADDLLEHMARMQGWNLKAVSIQKEDNFVECEPMINIPEYKVGDEVIRDSKRGVIVRGPYPIGLSAVGGPEYYVQIWYGTFMSSSSVRNIAPTGRHFDQVDFLINEMNREINEGK